MDIRQCPKTFLVFPLGEGEAAVTRTVEAGDATEEPDMYEAPSHYKGQSSTTGEQHLRKGYAGAGLQYREITA